MSVRATAIAVGGYPREVSRVAKRYAERGLDAALSDDPRPHPERKLDSAQEAAIVAMGGVLVGAMLVIEVVPPGRGGHALIGEHVREGHHLRRQGPAQHFLQRREAFHGLLSQDTDELGGMASL
ncbi:hypothetical protein [Sandaracinus amylolyticus]|uniref:hypothetical protein n=1 Tax=Sandaracinus TaxID=1055688 RepID=UPI003AF3C712